MFHELQIFYESHKLQEFQKLHESYINNVFLLQMELRKYRDLVTKTVHIKGVVDTIQGANHPDNARIFGLSMTYDDHLIITFSDGVAVIDRELNTSSASFYRFADDEYGSNSIAVEENNGI